MRPIREKIAAARQFSECLQAPDERNEVERGVERSAHDALAPDRAADRDERDGAAQPRQRPYEPAGQSASGITPELG